MLTVLNVDLYQAIVSVPRLGKDISHFPSRCNSREEREGDSVEAFFGGDTQTMASFSPQNKQTGCQTGWMSLARPMKKWGHDSISKYGRKNIQPLNLSAMTVSVAFGLKSKVRLTCTVHLCTFLSSKRTCDGAKFSSHLKQMCEWNYKWMLSFHIFF